MLRLFFIALLGMTYSTILNGQVAVERDTIIIEPNDYEKRIVFNSAMLFEIYGAVDTSINCVINAKDLLDYLRSEPFERYSVSLFEEKELKQHFQDLIQYIEKSLEASDQYTMQRPAPEIAMKFRNLLEDMNYGIFYLLRWGYYADSMKLGQVQFYYREFNSYARKIHVHTKRPWEGRTMSSYYLGLDGRKVFSEDIQL